MPGVVDDHERSFGRQVVQPRESRVGKAVLQQRVPAVEVCPLRSALGYFAPYRVDDIVGIADGDRPDVDHAVGQHDRLHQRMAMCLNESRHHTTITGIEHFGTGSDPSLDLGSIADGDDPAV